MPNTPSAKNALKKSNKRRERNRGRRSAMRTYVRRVMDAIEENNLETAEKNLSLATKLIDKNVKWNQMHQNTAARKKSRLAQAVNTLRTA